jgi:hypothetical protein
MEYREQCRRIYSEAAKFVTDTWQRLVGYIKTKMDERRAKKEKENPTDRAAHVTASATKWMAVFTFILAISSGLTLCILHNQLTEMHTGGIDTHALAQATEDASGAASDQADAAQQFSDTAEDINDRMSDAVDQLKAANAQSKSAVSASIEALRTDQRAWLGTKKFVTKGSFEVLNGIQATAIVENTGRTPAVHYNSEIAIKAFCNGFPKHPSYNRTGLGEPSFLTLNPGQSAQVPSKIFTFETLESVSRIETRDCHIYVFGRIIFRDIFRRDHWRHFCGYYSFPAAVVGDAPDLVSCSTYNDGDEEYTDSKEPN